MGMSDFPAKVRAKFSRRSPARSPLSNVEAAPQEPEPEPEPAGPAEQQRQRRSTWSLRSRGAAAAAAAASSTSRSRRLRPRTHLRHALELEPPTMESSSRGESSSSIGGGRRDHHQREDNSQGGRADSEHTTARASGQSQVGSDRREVVLSSTPPRETDNDLDPEHQRQLLQQQLLQQGDEHQPQQEEHHDKDGVDFDSNQSERRSTTSLVRHGSTSSSRLLHAASSRNPLPSPDPDFVLDPTSSSAAQSPERYRITRTVLEEYEAEQEVRPNDSIPRPVPSRGPSLASNRNSSYTTSQNKPPGPTRKQSLLPQQSQALIRSLLGPGEVPSASGELNSSFPTFEDDEGDPLSPSMVSRKVWVKRPGASATLVTVVEDSLVDDVRDMILRKYANTLGRSFDSPDVTLRVIPRENRQERTLGPEEPICQVLDGFFPGGQTVDEALVIDVPLRRTPRPSPQAVPVGRYYQEEERRPQEAASEYFPPMPVPTVPSPHLPASHSMSVLTTGHVPNLPSPGGRRQHHRDRPRLPRQHTASPAVMTGQPQLPQQHSDKSGSAPAAPPLPSPPAAQQNGLTQIPQVAPPPRISSPRPPSRPKKTKKSNSDHPSFPAGMLNGAVPPINVLIVEDNIINLKLLEAFMKRLKVRSQNAMNGREAVTKWRTGGFHLVLMDIQLPIMNGLDATKEIRRLERLNSIGVFTSSAGSSAPPETVHDEAQGDDKLSNINLFKSPVIIVALTASSLQSDRHEALAAGCNDFLTKPVNFVWLERKVMEWGCMQALIDYDGWRQWKDFSQDSRDDDSKDSKKGSTGSGASGGKKKKHRPSAGSSPSASTSHISTKDLNEPVGLGVNGGEGARTPNH